METTSLKERIEDLQENQKLNFVYNEGTKNEFKGEILRFTDLGEEFPIIQQCSITIERPGRSERYNLDWIDEEFIYLYTFSMVDQKKFSIKMNPKPLKLIES